MSIVQVTGDASGYVATTGFALPASIFSLNTYASTSDFQLQAPPANPVGVWADGSHAGAGLGGYAQIDNTTGNLRLFSSGGTEVAGGGNSSTYVTVLIAFGH